MVHKHLPVVPVAIALLKKDLISGTLFLFIMKGCGTKIITAKIAAAKITAAKITAAKITAAKITAATSTTITRFVVRTVSVSYVSIIVTKNGSKNI